MKKTIVAALLAALSAAAPAAYGAEKENDGGRIWLPIGLSIVAPPVQLPSPSHTVFGGMVNLGYGQVENIAILDAGIANNVTGTMYGVQAGALNFAGNAYGVQAGVFNSADVTAGLQIGVLNFTGDLHGVQIGVLNFSSSGGALVFPVVNIGF